jgi:alpha-amylase
MNDTYGEGWFFVGEFWKDSLDDMCKYLERMGKKFSLFDAPLVYNFSQASKTENADLTKIFEGTLVQTVPVNAVVRISR